MVQSYDVIDVDDVKKEHGLAEMRGGFTFWLDKDHADYARQSIHSLDPRYATMVVSTFTLDRTNGFSYIEKKHELAPCTTDSLALKDLPEE